MTEVDIQLWQDHEGFYWKHAADGLRLLFGPYPTRDAAMRGAQALNRGSCVFSDVMLPPEIRRAA